MTRNTITGVLLITGAVLFILLVLFVEKMNSTVLSVGAFVMIATVALFLYLYYHRFSKTGRWILLILYIVPAVSILISKLLKS